MDGVLLNAGITSRMTLFDMTSTAVKIGYILRFSILQNGEEEELNYS